MIEVRELAKVLRTTVAEFDTVDRRNKGMTMEVFICWSGFDSASHILAKGLHEWLQRVIQAVQPFLSSENIDSGSRWNVELRDRLARINLGIICMTPENVREPWIHFESGALTKNLEDGSVTALLLDVKFSDLTPPLQQFQHRLLTKEDVRKLIGTINSKMGEKKLDEKRLDASFELNWPSFVKVIEEAHAKLASSAVAKPKQRESAEMFEEILTVVHDMQREVRPLAKALERLSNSPAAQVPRFIYAGSQDGTLRLGDVLAGGGNQQPPVVFSTSSSAPSVLDLYKSAQHEVSHPQSIKSSNTLGQPPAAPISGDLNKSKK